MADWQTITPSQYYHVCTHWVRISTITDYHLHHTTSATYEVWQCMGCGALRYW